MTDQIKVRGRSSSEYEVYPVVRVLRWYEKDGDRLVGESVLEGLELPELQKLFQESDDNLMVDSYPVSVSQTDRLQREIKEPIDLSTYNYYLECDAI